MDVDKDGETTSRSQFSDREIADTDTFVNALRDAATGTESLQDGAWFNVCGERFHFPEKIVRTPAFQHSYLALLLKGVTPRGLSVARSEQGDVIVENSRAESFKLLLDHLCDKKPLTNVPFESVTQAYEDLLGEVIQWRLPRTYVTLPARLWTARRWTDLNAWYALTPRERLLLAPTPVAVQLIDEEFPTPLFTSQQLTKEECDKLIEDELVGDLLSTGENEVLAGYHIEGYYCLVAKESSQSPAEGVSNTLLSGFATPGCASWEGCSLFLKVPGFVPQRVVTYSLPTDFKLPPPPTSICDIKLPAEYPYMYRKRNRVYWWFSVNFGLEIAETSDPTTEDLQLRVIQVGHREKQSPQTATPPASGWLVPRSSLKGRDEWMCYHPDLTPTVRYTSGTKLYRDISLGTFFVKRIRFYPWGALVVSEHLESPFAVLCIDEVDMKRIYGEKVQIWLKGPCSSISRSEIDVAVAPDLSRVYLCICGSLVSQPVAPTSSKIVFEFTTQLNGRPKVKLSHVHIAEGSPVGSALVDMCCLGVLADFDPSTGLYYQAEISRMLCSRFVKLHDK
eukprot:Gregarina_sp_Poly_1__1511@NODE_137_length_13137_cov_148_628156_g122_i0_p3_GENE_NODE_137_length_13137_cov_148_628156_g122_i0NODE_137_length_13137_cov_148_628156_g122_i0_p3_ORF_typecomplete_len564_score52_08_NODE_137_length_13137_cov_148_628156_g122_i025694260